MHQNGPSLSSQRPRVFKCPSCDKAFAKPSQLERHNRTHTGKVNRPSQAHKPLSYTHTHITLHTYIHTYTQTYIISHLHPTWNSIHIGKNGNVLVIQTLFKLLTIIFKRIVACTTALIRYPFIASMGRSGQLHETS